VQVWQRSGLWNSVNRVMLHTDSASEIVFQLLQVLLIADSKHLVVTIWSMWTHRNLKLWQDVSETVAQVVERAVWMLEDWQLANNYSPAVRNP
jgi:hypothetical protein